MMCASCDARIDHCHGTLVVLSSVATETDGSIVAIDLSKREAAPGGREISTEAAPAAE